MQLIPSTPAPRNTDTEHTTSIQPSKCSCDIFCLPPPPAQVVGTPFRAKGRPKGKSVSSSAHRACPMGDRRGRHNAKRNATDGHSATANTTPRTRLLARPRRQVSRQVNVSNISCLAMPKHNFKTASLLVHWSGSAFVGFAHQPRKAANTSFGSKRNAAILSPRAMPIETSDKYESNAAFSKHTKIAE